MTSCLNQVESHYSVIAMLTALIRNVRSYVPSKDEVRRNMGEVTSQVRSHVPSKDEVRRNMGEVTAQVRSHVPSKDEVRRNMGEVTAQVRSHVPSKDEVRRKVNSIGKIQELRKPLKPYIVGVGPIKMDKTFYLLRSKYPETQKPKPSIRSRQRFLTSLRARIEEITDEEINEAIEKKNQDLVIKYDRIMQIRKENKRPKLN